ncbi:MAG: hypothetical protein QM728_13950 [Gordonia sp. (in: high G+C Gram-positive bacteria)]|uniref:hypothetical protein n=1 Tax=Gordonia sp. (in: high G+C Gram-positive bacteria) TaxID=84139 RepID=UPI0039E24CDE
MKTKAAILAGLAIAGLSLAAPAAHAAPVEGAACSKSELGDLRYTSAGKPVACITAGRPTPRWTQTAKVDPIVREGGTACSGTYPVARNRAGKAIMCVSGVWMYGP